MILETLSQRGPLTLDELARAVQSAPPALRYHLRILVADGLVAPQDVTHRARVGRPPAVYALTARAHAHLPHQYEWLAVQLLDELARTYSEREMRATLRRIGQRLAKTTPLPRTRVRLSTRLTRAVDVLCARGYAARLEKSDGDWMIHVCYCPYQNVAAHQRAVCELDLALIGTLTQVPWRMTHCLARQDTECTFVVSSARKMKKGAFHFGGKFRRANKFAATTTRNRPASVSP